MNSKIFILDIIVAIFVVALTTPYEANALNQSGQLTIDATTGNSYSAEGSGTANGGTFLWTRMFFDSTHYNKLNNLLITFEPNWVFANEAESTGFTITAGGTGSGIVSYNKNGRNIFFDCGGCTITSSPVTISYDSNILNNVTVASVQHGGTAAITTPIYFGGLDTTISQCSNTPNFGCSFQTSTSMVFSNNYRANYTVVGNDVIANVSIDKSISTVQSKVFILNSTATKFSESAFNTNSYSFSFVYDTGIALNMTDASGNNDFVVVNSTAYTGPGIPPTSTPTPPPIPSGSDTAISFDKSVYNVGDQGIITTNSSGLSSFLGIYTFRVDFYSTQNPLINQFQMDLSKISQQFLVSFDSADTYTANIVKHNVLFGTDTIVANASAQAQQPVSYIFAPSIVNTGNNINISYLFNPVPTSGAIEDVITDQFGFNGIGTYINTTLCPCSSNLTSINYTINGPGKHTLRLWDTQHIKVVASTIVQVNNVGDIVPGNIVNNLLQLDNTQYSINDVINAQYQISSFNWTNFSYFKGILVSSGGVGMGFVSLTSQTGTFQIPVSGGAFNIIQAGPAFVNVTGGDSVFDPGAVVLMSVPVTILSNAGGYGIVVQPTTICLTQTVVAKYTAPFPSVSSAILQIEYMTPAGTTQFSNTSFTSNGTQNIVFNNGKVKDQSGVLFNILDSSGNFQVNSIIKYQSTGCIVPGGTATPTPTATETGEQKSNDLVGLLQSNIFWALMFIAGLMVVVASKERKGP